jgi:hypothetical protein
MTRAWRGLGMIDGLVAGRLMGDVVRRLDRAGRNYVVARVLARNRGDEEFIVNVIAFDDGPGEALLAMGDGDALSLAGALTPKVWVDKQGNHRPSLDMVAHRVIGVREDEIPLA